MPRGLKGEPRTERVGAKARMGLLKHENTQSRGKEWAPSKVSRKKELIWEKEPRRGAEPVLILD